MRVYTTGMKLPSQTEYELLVVLAPRELPGRTVAQRYEEQTGRGIAYGTLYTTLRRMTEAGWIKARDDEDEDGRVRHFKVTGLGDRAITEGRKTFSALATLGLSPRRAG